MGGGERGVGVDVDGVAAGRLVDGDIAVGEGVREPLDLGDAFGDVRRFDGLPEADGERRHVAAGHPAVRREALVEDAALAALLVEAAVVVEADEPADVDQAVFLPAHDAGVGVRELLAGDGGDGVVLVAGFALLDEVGVLGEPAGVDDERGVDVVGERGDLAGVLDADRLAGHGVVGDGEHDDGDGVRADVVDDAAGAFDRSCP